ncbi:MAG: PBP1A family penicillin-binding protein [Clostridia bacterium]|nr:PBP1A family penicillin-binding protein [Clostridia bacterium]
MSDSASKGSRQAPSSRPAKQKKQKTGVLRRIGQVIGTLFLIGMLTGLMVLGCMYYYIVNYLDPQMNIDLDSYKLAYTSYVYYYDENGTAQLLESLHGDENREWVDLVEIPQHVQDAAVSIEDERFWEHNGVDWKRTAAAVVNLLTGGSGGRFGASTIAQQVVKNVTGDDDYSMMRKIEEILRALNLCKKYSKESILEFYLNTAYFGQNTNGVQAAAKIYFDKDVSELTIAEGASIIGITKYPSRYNPFMHEDYNKERQETVLWKMQELGKISQEEYAEAVDQKLEFQKEKVQLEQAQVQSWYVDEVIKNVLDDLVNKKGYPRDYATTMLYQGGLRIYAAIDMNVQRVLDEKFAAEDTFPTLNGEEQPKASMTVIDPYTGAVLGIAGDRGEKTGARLFNYATDAKRQPGSTMKPLAVYAPAIEYNVITQGSVYDDAPYDVEKKYPRNYDSSYAPYRGRMDVKEAVYRSVNTVPIAILDQMGTERSFDFVTENLGLTTLVRSETINGSLKTDIGLAPLALGGVTWGVTNLEMAAAYAAFVNKGVYNKPYTYTRVEAYDGTVLLEHEPNPQVAMSEQTAYLINSLLQGVVTSGTGTPAQISGMPVAGKTGTTSDDVDRWFVGYTPYYVGVCWFGYEQPRTIRYSGTNPAIQGWRAVMRELHEGLPRREFFSTTGIVSASYCLDSGMVPTAACSADPRGSRVSSALFKKGTTPTEPCNVHISATLCADTNMAASPYCHNRYEASLIHVHREYPYTLGVVDAQYTWLPLPVGYTIPADSSVPIYQNLLTPGTNPGYSPGVDDPMNQLCVLHYGYSAPQPGDPGYRDPSNPITPEEWAAMQGDPVTGEPVTPGTDIFVNPLDPVSGPPEPTPVPQPDPVPEPAPVPEPDPVPDPVEPPPPPDGGEIPDGL